MRLRNQLVSKVAKVSTPKTSTEQAKSYLQTGHVPFCFSHGIMHSSWKECAYLGLELQGKVMIDGVSVTSKVSLHTAQSFCNSGPGNKGKH